MRCVRASFHPLHAISTALDVVQVSPTPPISPVFYVNAPRGNGVWQVDFVQNMVYCIERAYRTPDYCLWDLDIVDHSRARIVELSASSIGE
jgi:hypothetical protein